MPSSKPITRTPGHSFGPKPKFTSVASKGGVSVNCDSGVLGLFFVGFGVSWIATVFVMDRFTQKLYGRERADRS